MEITDTLEIQKHTQQITKGSTLQYYTGTCIWEFKKNNNAMLL